MSLKDDEAFEKEMDDYMSQFVACFISKKQSKEFWDRGVAYARAERSRNASSTET